jgi:hypothetical protein
MPIELSPTFERVMHITGKTCLRNAFPDSLAAYRRKDPIEVGSGSTDFNLGKGGAAFFGGLLGMDESPEGQQAFKLEQEVGPFLRCYRNSKTASKPNSDIPSIILLVAQTVTVANSLLKQSVGYSER